MEKLHGMTESLTLDDPSGEPREAENAPESTQGYGMTETVQLGPTVEPGEEPALAAPPPPNLSQKPGHRRLAVIARRLGTLALLGMYGAGAFILGVRLKRAR